MARIPIYQEQQSVSQNMPVSEMRAPNMNADAIGRALGQVGAAFKDVANVMGTIEDEKAKTWAAETASQARVDWQARVQRMQESAEPGAPGFTQMVSKEFDAWSEETMKSAPNRVAQNYLATSLTQLNDNVKMNAIQFEAIEGRANRVRQLKQSFQNDAIFLANSNDPEQLARLRGSSDAILDSAKITNQQREELRQNRDTLWGRTGVEKQITDNPQSLIDQRNAAKKAGLRTSGNAFLDMLPPDQWDTYIRAAETKIKQDQAIFRGELEARVRDANAMALDGITDPNPPSAVDFERAYGDKAAEARASYNRTQQLARDISGLKTATREELIGIVNARAPAPGKGYAEASQRHDVLKRAAAEVIKQRDSDPATAVSQSALSVQKAEKDMADAMSSSASSPELIKSTTQKFVTASLAEQQRLGISKPRVLTNAQVEALGTRIASGTEKASDLVASLEQQYGTYFPQVMEELMDKKKLPPALMIIPDLPSPASRELVSRLSAVKRSDLEAGVDKALIKDVKAQATEEVARLRATGGPQTANSAEQMAAYQDMMERIAMDGIARGVYSNGTDAAKGAAKMLLGHYQFSGTLRLPVNMDADAVESGLKSSLANKIIPSITTADVPESVIRGKNPEQAVAEWRSTVGARSFWLADRDTKNAQLWAKLDNGLFVRVLIGGKQVQVPFSDAVTSGASQRYNPAEQEVTDQNIGGA